MRACCVHVWFANVLSIETHFYGVVTSSGLGCIPSQLWYGWRVVNRYKLPIRKRSVDHTGTAYGSESRSRTAVYHFRIPDQQQQNGPFAKVPVEVRTLQLPNGTVSSGALISVAG